MKKIASILFLGICHYIGIAQSQVSIPEAPQKIEFANVLVNLKPEALAKVNAEITKLLTPQNKFLEQKLERMQWYFPLIEAILEEEQVPEDLKYLSVMESSLLPEAISSSNAVGFWQFKEVTGKEMGLKIDNDVDERKNIIYSTRAAVTYLKKHNLLYKNWISAMMAYKEGATGAEAHVPVDWSFSKEISFDDNTNIYLIRALAHRVAYEHRLNRIKESNKKFVEYQASGKSLAEIAVDFTLNLDDLRKYNSWLYAPNVPSDKHYKILILTNDDDSGTLSTNIKKRADAQLSDTGYPKLKRITQVSTSADDPIYYEINGKKGIMAQSGDEVAQMAKKAKVKISSFLKYNEISDRNIATTGNVYYLQKKNKKADVPFHTVTGTQSLWEVSQMYGVQVKSLKKFNRMNKTEEPQTGRVLWMQKTRPKKQKIEYIQEVIPAPEITNESLPVKETYTEKEPETKIVSTPIIEEKTIDAAPAVLEKPIVVIETPIAKAETPSTKVEPKVTATPKAVEAKNTPKEQPKPVVTIIKKESGALDENDPLFNTKDKIAKKETKPAEKPSSSTAKTHTVVHGETLFSIAKKYGMTVTELRKLNNFSPNDILKSNQVLVLKTITLAGKDKIAEKVNPQPPVEKPIVAVAPTVKSESTSNKTINVHTVTRGETLYAISKKYGVSILDLKSWNNLNSNEIEASQKLIVRKNNEKIIPTEPSKVIAKSNMHKVGSGETLFSISKKYDVTIDQLKTWNNLSNNTINQGQNLKVSK